MNPIPGNYRLDERYHVYAICTDDVQPGQHPEVAFIERIGRPDGAGSITAQHRTTAELLGTARLFALAPRMLKVIRDLASPGINHGECQAILAEYDAPDDEKLAEEKRLLDDICRRGAMRNEQVHYQRIAH